MKNGLSLVARIALCIGLTAPLTSLATGSLSGRCPANVPVTSTLQGAGPFSIPTYRIQSDLLGPYQNGVDSIISILQGCSGDWLFDTGGSTSRTVLIDLRDPVRNSGATPPFAYQYLPPRIIAKAHETTAGSIMGMHGLNSSILSPLSAAFNYAGSSYGLRMNPLNWPQTNYALVTCTGVVDPTNPATSRCNQWTITPSVTQPDGELKSIAHLERLVTVKGKTTSENHGDYYISFSILVTNP